MSDKELMKIEYETDNGQKVILSPGIVRKYLVSGGGNVTDGEIVMFLKMCQYRKMNPFLRECYLIKYGAEAAAFVVGKEYFTKKAEKIKTYNGFRAGIYVQANDKIDRRDGSCYFEGEKLLGGWAEVYRDDRDNPTIAEVKLEEYIGYKKDGKPNRQWSRMPATMIRKVAIVQSHREAYPEEFDGLYDAAEIVHNNTPVADSEERNNLIMDIEQILSNNFFDGRQADILEKVDATQTIAALKAIKESLENELSTAMESQKEKTEDAEYEKINTSKFDNTIKEAEAELEKARGEVGELFKGVNNE